MPPQHARCAAMITDMESSTQFLTGTTGWTMALALAAVIAYLIPALAAQRMTEPLARSAMRAAWVLHLLTIAAGLVATPARFGFAPALSMTAWLMLTMYAIEQQLYPKMRAVGVLSALGALAVLLAQLFPGNRWPRTPRHGCLCTWHWALPPMGCALLRWCTLV